MARKMLITGASSGIGKALAFEAAARGYALGLTARRSGELEKIRDAIMKKESNAVVAVRKLDVTDYDDVAPALLGIADELGGLDIVVANAGIGLGDRVGKGEFEKARRTIETNLTGAIATIDAAASYFYDRGSGHIVGISSVAAFRGLPRSASYSATKAGLAIYLEALRAESRGRNLDVTVLYPGFIDTPLNDMLPSRPFLISVEKGAGIIARLIEKRVASSTVPVFPWNVVSRILKLLPTGIIAKL